MANEALLISGIGYKVRKLIEARQHLQEENEKLKKELQEARVLIKKLETEVESKRNKLIKTSLANALMNRESVEEGIRTIDRLVDEIDRGIDVLSD